MFQFSLTSNKFVICTNYFYKSKKKYIFAYNHP
jgi:hypothetical protein